MRSRDAYRRAERCLYHYRKNLLAIDVLKSELEGLQNSGDVHAQDYTWRMKTSASNADPVNAYTHKLLMLEHRNTFYSRRHSLVSLTADYLFIKDNH